jgi:hypothetical protein
VSSRCAAASTTRSTAWRFEPADVMNP